jgi:hypothetical protein
MAYKIFLFGINLLKTNVRDYQRNCPANKALGEPFPIILVACNDVWKYIWVTELMFSRVITFGFSRKSLGTCKVFICRSSQKIHLSAMHLMMRAHGKIYFLGQALYQYEAVCLPAFF